MNVDRVETQEVLPDILQGVELSCSEGNQGAFNLKIIIILWKLTRSTTFRLAVRLCI